MIYVSECKSLRQQKGMFIHNILTFCHFCKVFHVPSLEQRGDILKKQLTTTSFMLHKIQNTTSVIYEYNTTNNYIDLLLEPISYSLSL